MWKTITESPTTNLRHYQEMKIRALEISQRSSKNKLHSTLNEESTKLLPKIATTIAVLETMMEEDKGPLKLNNKFLQKNPNQPPCVHVNFATPNGWVMEVQLTLGARHSRPLGRRGPVL